MNHSTPLSVVILSMLNEGPMHPYQVTFEFRQRHMEEHVKMTVGALYHTFERLRQEAAIEPVEVEREGRRPERTVYRLTDAGRERLHAGLIRLLAEPSHVYSDFEAGLACMHDLPGEEAAALLRQRADSLEADAAAEAVLLDGARATGLTRLSLIENELVQDLRDYQIKWCRRIADEIDSGELEWIAGHVPRLRRATCPDVTQEVNG